MKRNLSRFVLLVIVVSFALSILSIGVSAESVDLSKYGRYMLSKMPGGADLVKTYDEFEAAIDAGLTTVDFSTLIPMETFSNYIYTALENDHPEWYYFERNSTPVYYQNAEGFPVVKANPAYNKLNASSYKTAFDNAVKACIALSGVTNEMSDYEKSLRIHDALCKTVTYDYSLSGENIYNAYGALVEGSAVCQGYAKAYQYLLKQVGISSSVVTGLSYNVATAQTDRHMWNIVLLDGEYYLTDVTWDDQNGDIFHGYLNVTTDTMSEDHITQMVYDVPLCTATANNYFLKNGGIVYVKDSAPYVENENEVYNYVKSGISTTGVAKIFVIGTNKGNIFSWYNSVVNKLVNDLGYTGTINIGATYVGREFHLIMSAEHGQSTTPTTSTTVTTATTPTTSTTVTTATTPTTSTTATTATTPTTSTTATTATTPTISTTATTATTPTTSTTATTATTPTTSTTATTATTPTISTTATTATTPTTSTTATTATTPTTSTTTIIVTTATTDTVQTSVTTTAVSTIATTVTAVETTAVSTTQQTTAESSSITDESTEILSTIITSETSVPSQTTTIKGTESIIDEWNNQKEELKHTFGCSSLLTGGSIVLTAIVVCLSLVATKKRED